MEKIKIYAVGLIFVIIGLSACTPQQLVNPDNTLENEVAS